MIAICCRKSVSGRGLVCWSESRKALSRDDGLEEISSSPRPRTRMPIRGIRGRRLEYDARREPPSAAIARIADV